MRAINPNDTVTVTAPFDTDATPSEFDIAIGIVGADRSRLMDMSAANTLSANEGRGKPSDMIAFFKECVRVGLRGIRHFYGRDGKPVAVVFVDVDGRRVVADSVIDELAATPTPGTGFDTLLNWLGVEIWQRTTLTAEQKKTFDAQLKSVRSASNTPASNGMTTTPTTETANA